MSVFYYQICFSLGWKDLCFDTGSKSLVVLCFSNHIKGAIVQHALLYLSLLVEIREGLPWIKEVLEGFNGSHVLCVRHECKKGYPGAELLIRIVINKIIDD